jgi:hypothetical protein
MKNRNITFLQTVPAFHIRSVLYYTRSSARADTPGLPKSACEPHALFGKKRYSGKLPALSPYQSDEIIFTIVKRNNCEYIDTNKRTPVT